MSCFGGAKERIFLLDMMVDKIKLTKDTIQDIGDHRLVVNIKFIDFPIIEISQSDFYFAKPSLKEDDCTLKFSSGRSCLFVEQPRKVVHAMQSVPLKIGVFCTSDTYPIAEAEVPLSGCMCNQIAMAGNDDDHLPKPYVLKGGFNLLDPGENPAGIIYIEFHLTCCGRFIMTPYRVDSKTLYFANENNKDQSYVGKIASLNFENKELSEISNQNNEEVNIPNNNNNELKSFTETGNIQ